MQQKIEKFAFKNIDLTMRKGHLNGSIDIYFNPFALLTAYSAKILMKHRNHENDFYVCFLLKDETFFYFVDFFFSMAILLHIYTA